MGLLGLGFEVFCESERERVALWGKYGSGRTIWSEGAQQREGLTKQ